MNKTTRIPRPKGLTEISENYYKQTNSPPQKTNEENHITTNNETLNPIEEHIIRHYINTGYRYCNQSMDIITFSNYTGIDENKIHQVIIGKTKDMGIGMDKEAVGDQVRGILFGILGGALSDRQTALYHQQLLLGSQGDSYKPFISGEVTKALKLSQEANAQVLNILKSIMPNKGPQILNQFNTQNIYPNGEDDSATSTPGLTVEQALAIIHQSESYVPLLEDQSQKEALKLEYLSDPEIPEVRAMHQHGMDVDREGLNFGKIAELSDGLLVDDNKHQDRRAKELDIDLESDEI